MPQGMPKGSLFFNVGKYFLIRKSGSVNMFLHRARCAGGQPPGGGRRSRTHTRISASRNGAESREESTCTD